MAAGPAPRVEPPDYSANRGLALDVPADAAGCRIDQILARLLTWHSRTRIQAWIREGRVRVGGISIVEPRHRLWGGESIQLFEGPDCRADSDKAEDIPLRIVDEDDWLMVIDKPPGLVVHPGSGNWSGTLLNALLHHAPQLASVPRAGIVHRLDKDTSGLMVVAKTLETHTELVRQLQARTVRRHYQALARGRVEIAGIIDAPIGRHPTLRTKMAIVETGKPARTHYRPLESFADCTLIECALETGRTHQIRVHLAAQGHPLVGDAVYGGGGARRAPPGPPFPRQALHACRLVLVHPATGRPIGWTSCLPKDMAALIGLLRLGVGLPDERFGDQRPADRHGGGGDPEVDLLDDAEVDAGEP